MARNMNPEAGRAEAPKQRHHLTHLLRCCEGNGDHSQRLADDYATRPPIPLRCPWVTLASVHSENLTWIFCMQQTPRDSGLVAQKVAPLGVWRAGAAGIINCFNCCTCVGAIGPLQAPSLGPHCQALPPTWTTAPLLSTAYSHPARQQLYRRNAEKDRRGPIRMPMCILPPEGCQHFRAERDYSCAVFPCGSAS